MSKQAWLYVTGVIIAGLLLAAAITGQRWPAELPWPAFAVLLLLAAVAHLTGAMGAYHEIWQANLIFLFAGLLLLPPQLFVWLVIIPHALEWAKERLLHSERLKEWYIQPFNIAVHLIAGYGAYRVYSLLNPAGNPLYTSKAILASVLTALVYISINHYLVGQAFVLARGISWRESKLLDGENLLAEFVQLILGYTLAVLWQFNALLILPALAPLVLIFRSLRVPQLERAAQTDPKTGLWNLRHWRSLAGAELDRAQRFQRPLALIMADLDYLRSINNVYGHLAGDIVLGGIGQIIKQNLREFDIAARFGGEEFAIVLPEVNLRQARDIAERIRRAVEKAPFDVRSSPEPIHATISLGVIAYPDDADTLDGLIHKADLALYHAKLNGRNRVALANDIPTSIHLETASVAALAASQAEPRPQPPEEHGAPAPAPIPSPASQANPADAEPARAAPAVSKAEKGAEELVARRGHIPYRIIVVFLAGLLVLAAIYDDPALRLTPILLFGALAVLSELFTVRMFGSSSLSVAAAAVFAVAFLDGITGVAIVSALIALVQWLRLKPAFYKVPLNWAAHTLAGAIPYTVIRLTGLEISVANLAVLFVPTILSALGYYLVETGVVAAAISLARHRQSVLATWQEHFQWLAEHYVVLGIIGLFLAVAWTAMGAAGVFVFALPLVMMHYVERQYTSRTEKSVLELRRLNEELAVANAEVRAASESIQKLNEELFLVLSKAIDARDPYVLGHAAQVAEYATLIARELNLSAEETELLRQAGFLHDIGKIGISEIVLHKPDVLTPNEYEYVKTHVTIGADLLQSSQSLRPLAPFIRYHHERWDGSGYPEGRKGEEIPLGARILAVCDAVEAMISERTYSPAMSFDAVIAELKRCSGAHFDPQVVQALIQVLQRDGDRVLVDSSRGVAMRRNVSRFGVTPTAA